MAYFLQDLCYVLLREYREHVCVCLDVQLAFDNPVMSCFLSIDFFLSFSYLYDEFTEVTDILRQNEHFWLLLYIVMGACSVMSDSLRPRGLWPNRLLCPWDFPSKDTGVGCQFLFQGIFLTQRLNLHLCVSYIGSGFYTTMPLVILLSFRVFAAQNSARFV